MRMTEIFAPQAKLYLILYSCKNRPDCPIIYTIKSIFSHKQIRNHILWVQTVKYDKIHTLHQYTQSSNSFPNMPR